MLVTITIRCDNAAFHGDEPTGDDAFASGAETARILQYLAATLRDDGLTAGDGHNLFDFNGNKVGECYVD